jgi:hypothetical protein
MKYVAMTQDDADVLNIVLGGMVTTLEDFKKAYPNNDILADMGETQLPKVKAKRRKPAKVPDELFGNDEWDKINGKA